MSISSKELRHSNTDMNRKTQRTEKKLLENEERESWGLLSVLVFVSLNQSRLQYADLYCCQSPQLKVQLIQINIYLTLVHLRCIPSRAKAQAGSPAKPCTAQLCDRPALGSGWTDPKPVASPCGQMQVMVARIPPVCHPHDVPQVWRSSTT